MAAKLVVEEGELKGLSLSLEDGESWIIGRDPEECQLVVEDPLVSRKHLIARQTAEGITVENLSLTNPVIINDEEEASQEPRLLQNGDTLKIGNEIFRFYEESSAQLLDKDLEEISEFDDIDYPSESESEEATSTEESKGDLPESLLPSEESVSVQPQDENLPQDTVFADEGGDEHALAEIDFGFIETGRWLLKVIGGPNSGAEFYMQTGNSYVIGTDPHTCDIVFHDTSVSRQHARITITPEDALIIENLKSRNGVLINGSLIEEKQELPQSTIITVGTTSFVVYDREGEMQTIISPLLPSIVKVLQQEPTKEQDSSQTKPEEIEQKEEPPVEASPAEKAPVEKPHHHFGSYIVLSAIIGLFVLAGIGTTTLFHEEPVVTQTQENANELIQQVLTPIPSIRWTFNKSNGSLLLLGHVATLSDKNRLLYKLADLKFIKNIDDSGIIIDEGVLNEVNSLIWSNPEWKGIRVYSPEAGQFILSGNLKSRKQAEQLASYLSLNFPYLDLLKKQVIVEEDVAIQIQNWLISANLPDVTVSINNGEVILGGNYPQALANDLNETLRKIKQLPGVRIVSNQTRIQTQETGTLNISDHYIVSGKSRLGDKYTVVINGRILSEGDELDGMTIEKITTNHIFLNKDHDKFRIDY